MAEQKARRTLLAVVALLAAMLPMAAARQAQAAPGPTMTVLPEEDRVGGDGWAPGTTITVSLRGEVVASTLTDGAGAFTVKFRDEGGWPGTVDIQGGDWVTVSDGATTKSYQVTMLTVDGIYPNPEPGKPAPGPDPVTNTVSGTADPYPEVCVHVDGVTGAVCASATDAGRWTANMTPLADIGRWWQGLPFGGYAVQSDDDGDATLVGWRVAGGVLAVDAESDSLWGWGWVCNQYALITIDDDPDPTDEVLYSTASGQIPCAIGQQFGFGDWGDPLGFDLQPGMFVTVDEGTLARTVRVTELAGIAADPDTDRVIGSAAPGSAVRVFAGHRLTFAMAGPFADDPLPLHRDVAADAVTGLWMVDFSVPQGDQGIFDIVFGTEITAVQSDDDGDVTTAGAYWPRFEVDPFSKEVRGDQWRPGGVVTVAVDGTPIGTTPVDPQGRFEYAAEQDLPDGSTLTVSEASLTKEHLVTALTVAGADADSEVVTGTAALGSAVEVWVDGTDYTHRHEIADPDGNWVADFAIPGELEDEQATADLQVGSSGGARQCDEDFDCTRLPWRIEETKPPWPPPWISVEPQNDRVGVSGFEAKGKAQLTVSRNDGSWIEAAADLNEWGEAQFDLTGQFDIRVDDLVVVTDGTTVKEHIVTGLSITGYDLASDLVWGTGHPGYTLFVKIGDAVRVATVGGDGTWLFNFASPSGDEGGLEKTADIGLGTSIGAEEHDEDFDSTWVSAQVPHPTFAVFRNTRPCEVIGDQWTEGTTVQVYLDDDPQIEQGDVPVASAPVLPYGPNPWEAGFSLTSDALPVVTGDWVIVTDGTFTKAHQIVDIGVIGYDRSQGTIFGFAPAGAQVEVYGVTATEEAHRVTTTGETGSWEADFFTEPPNPDGDNWGVLSMAIGTAGAAAVADDDGDRTLADYFIWGYEVNAFGPPVDVGVTNVATAGRTIPVKWRVQLNGEPMNDPGHFVSVTSHLQPEGAPPSDDRIETYSGNSGLQYLGDGWWQYNWKTPKAYAGQTRVMVLTLADGSAFSAYFEFH